MESRTPRLLLGQDKPNRWVQIPGQFFGQQLRSSKRKTYKHGDIPCQAHANDGGTRKLGQPGTELDVRATLLIPDASMRIDLLDGIHYSSYILVHVCSTTPGARA